MVGIAACTAFLATDSIERITSDSRAATIVTNCGKPTGLRVSAYRQLGEKLNEWNDVIHLYY